MRSFFSITQWLPDYQKQFLKGDIFAGLTVGVMLIPQGMAYALLAGLPPVYGLYASIVPQFIYAIFGTSRRLSVAPVAMDSLLVAGGVSVIATAGTETYIAYAILLALMIGIFQLLLGVFRLGFITNLLSKPVINGFTSAAAIIIAVNQLKYLLGINPPKTSHFYEVIVNIFSRLHEAHFLTIGIGLLGIAIILFSKKVSQKIPGALLAVVFGTLAVFLFDLDNLGVNIVREIPDGLPHFALPDFALARWQELIPLALTISVVAYMESFSVAKAMEAETKDHKVRPNQELISLGLANAVGSFFQAFPVAGGFSRSAVNLQSGAKTPMASIISGSIVALTLLFLTPLFHDLPEAILASVIMVAVFGLINFKYIGKLWAEDKIAFGLLVATFIATLALSMVIGIAVGVVLSILMLLYKAGYPHIAKLGRVKGHYEYRNVKRFKELETWENILILRLDAPLTFVNIQYFKDYIEEELGKAKGTVEFIILDAGPMNYMDASAVDGLSDLLETLNSQQIRLLLSEVVGPVRDTLFKTGLMDKIGTESIFLNLNGAVESVVSSDKTRYEDYALQHK